MNLWTFSDSHDFNQLKLGCFGSPSPPHDYAYTLCINLPQFCCLRRRCFGKDPWFSPYLLQVINPSFSWKNKYTNSSLPPKLLCTAKGDVSQGDETTILKCEVTWLPRDPLCKRYIRRRDHLQVWSVDLVCSENCNSQNSQENTSLSLSPEQSYIRQIHINK